MRNTASVTAALTILCAAAVQSAEWNQWRGPNGNGAAAASPELITELPSDGLQPVWMSEPIKSARDGGWGSPVVANGKMYLYAHVRNQLNETGERKFPWLAPDKRTGMTADEYAEYEVNRRNEDQERANAFEFRETLYCLDAMSGNPLWKYDEKSIYSRFPQSGTPTVADGRLYILGAGRLVRCFNAQTGKVVWESRLPGEFRDEFMQACIAVTEGVAVIMATHLFGVDTATGELLWEGDPNKTRGSHSSPVVWNHNEKNRVVVNVSGDQTICIDPRSGRELWRIQSAGGLSTPLIVGDKLLTYGNSRKKGLRCFQMSDAGAELKWTYNGVADKGSSPVIANGHVFVQGERKLSCVNLETGVSPWTVTLDLERPQYTSLIAADNKVIYGHRGVLCFEASADDYTPLLDARIDSGGLMATEDSFRNALGLKELEKQPDGRKKAIKLFQDKVGRHGPLDCATPAIADGRLYIRLKNAVACYDLASSRDAVN